VSREMTKGIKPRIIRGNYEILWEASGIALDEGREKAEKYLRARGLLDDNERLYSVEEEIDRQGQPISPHDGGMFKLRAIAAA
jgi:hypothetical protein